MKITLLAVGLVIGIYLLLCCALYFLQERLIFRPDKLPPDYSFTFQGSDFSELNFKMPDGVTINALLFKANHSGKSKGLVFYLHGNAGSLRTWGNIAKTYTALDYDVLMPDYRGYGKSSGEISSAEQLFADNQLIYQQLKKDYREENIVIVGYSLGTGLAAKLACDNQPRLLILQAPYYSFKDVAKAHYPLIPSFILRYNIETADYLKDCQTPVLVFHGDEDTLIPHQQSLKLKAQFKSVDQLVTLDGEDHHGMTDNPRYQTTIAEFLQ